MPVYNPKKSALSESLDAMSSIVDGYIQGEAVRHEREIEEREYGFRREQFDEGTRRFEESHEETIRQFDETISFNETQAELMRIEARETREDIQAEEREQAELGRKLTVSENQKARAVEYYRIKKINEANTLDRARLERQNNVAYMERLHGGYKSLRDVPAYHFLGNNGEVTAPENFNFRAELKTIASGGGHTFLDPSVTPGQAAEWLKAIEKGGKAAERAILESLLTLPEGAQGPFVPLLRTVQNTDFEHGITKELIRRSGMTDEQYLGQSSEILARDRAALYVESDNHEATKRKLFDDELTQRVALQQLENGSDPRLSINQGSTDAASRGQPLYMSGGIPRPSSFMESPAFDEDVFFLLVRGDEYNSVGDEGLSPEDADKKRNKIDNDLMKPARDRMIRIVEAKGGDPRQIESLYNDAKNGVYPPGNYFTASPVPQFDVPRKPVTTDTSRITVNGITYDPGNPSYEKAREVAAQEKRLAEAKKETAKVTAIRVAKELAAQQQKELADLAVTTQQMQVIEDLVQEFQSANPDATPEEIERFRRLMQFQSREEFIPVPFQ